MNRRQFLRNTAAFLGGACGVRPVFGQVGAAAADIAAGRLTVDLAGPSHLIPLNYSGLSYELAQLADPGFFAATNLELVALFRLLSPHGVLRLGGNSSEWCWFKADASVEPPETRPVGSSPEENWMPNQLFMIRPEAIDRLAEFLDATGWQLIYGLDFGHNTPERAARGRVRSRQSGRAIVVLSDWQ